MTEADIMGVLDEIIKDRKKSLSAEKKILSSYPQKSSIDFKAALIRKNNLPALIAEIKRKSPSKGIIRENITVDDAVKLYQPYASAISVLTEPDRFGGSLDDLMRTRELTDLPLLRKDFIIDTIQVEVARYCGADTYLLIVAALSTNQLKELSDAGREYNMTPLIEVHNRKEFDIAAEMGFDIIGFNNRNLQDLSIDLDRCHEASGWMDGSSIYIAESGIKTRLDIDSIPEIYSGVLIGTAVMGADDPENKLKELFGKRDH